MAGVDVLSMQQLQLDEPFTYQNLMQELIMALLGYTGDVFVDASDDAEGLERMLAPTACTIELAHDIRWIDARDREPFNQLVRLGFHCKQLRRFVDGTRSQTHASAYLRALCSGVSELLAVYTDSVLELQAALLEDPHQGLPGCQCHLADLQLLLPPLHELVWEVQHPGPDRGPLSGPELLHVLARRRLDGAPALQACVQRLLWHCHQVLFQQLTAWMVHGLLIDRAGEFFVQPAHALPQSRPDGTPWSSEELAYHDWHSAFGVDLGLLPPGVGAPLAQAAEFVGRAVRLLRAPAGASAGAQLLPPAASLAHAAALGRLQASEAEGGGVSPAALARVVEGIRADVAGRLWELLVVRRGLVAHLAAAKDYLLLARGDFWHSFLVDASKLLASPPRAASSDADVAVPFASAAAKTTAGADPLFALFTPHWSPEALQVRTAAGGHTYIHVPAFDPRGWDGLWLEFRPPWPLGVLLTPGHLARYGALFQLLLRLKRVQMALDDTWQLLGRMCGRGGGSAGVAPLLQLRHHMAHLVGNLQIYLQVDVIAAAWVTLERSVGAAKDFSEAERAHERYLHALVTQSFLSHASLCRQFGEVFGQARALSELVARAGDALGGVDMAAVQEVAAAFDRTIGSLYINLQSKTLQQYDKAPHLRQLYLRLDFNGFIGAQRMRMLQRAKEAAAGATAPRP